MHRTGRARFDANWIFAVVASTAKVMIDRSILALQDDRIHPSEELSRLQTLLVLARYLACAAAKTCVHIKKESQFPHRVNPSLFSSYLPCGQLRI
jgi:hypothetical protein